MIRLYSKGCENALKVFSRLTLSTRSFSIKKVCKENGLPEWSTRKTFQILVRKGLLNATSGPRGGYEFRIPPHKISLLALIIAIDGENVFNRCAIGVKRCRNSNPCPLHSIVQIVRGDFLNTLKRVSLLNLLQNFQDKKEKQK